MKLVKRQASGRDKVDLLRKRALRAGRRRPARSAASHTTPVHPQCGRAGKF